MKQLFTFIIALFAYTAIQAQTPITLINGDFEDLTEMAKNTSGKWAIKGFFLNDYPATPPGNYVDDSKSGLAPGQGDGGTQAFKVTPVQPDATSNTTYQIVSLTTDSIDISNLEFGKYTHKFYIKLSDKLLKARPLNFSYIATDANGVDVSAFTAVVTQANTDERQLLNANSAFNTDAATAGYQTLYSVVDVTANTNTDPLLGSVLNAKYLKFQFGFGKNMSDPGATGKPSTTFYFDNFSLTGPAEKTSGISSVNDDLKVQIYPNPTKDYAQINCADGIDEISLYSVTGSFIKKEIVGANSHNLDISKLSNGIYFISVKNDKGVVNTKINKF